MLFLLSSAHNTISTLYECNSKSYDHIGQSKLENNSSRWSNCYSIIKYIWQCIENSYLKICGHKTSFSSSYSIHLLMTDRTISLYITFLKDRHAHVTALVVQQCLNNIQLPELYWRYFEIAIKYKSIKRSLFLTLLDLFYPD